MFIILLRIKSLELLRNYSFGNLISSLMSDMKASEACEHKQHNTNCNKEYDHLVIEPVINIFKTSCWLCC